MAMVNKIDTQTTGRPRSGVLKKNLPDLPAAPSQPLLPVPTPSSPALPAAPSRANLKEDVKAPTTTTPQVSSITFT